MDPANLQCFSQPHWRVIAQGFQPEAWFAEGRGVGSGGILMPKPEDLLVGNRYYRFANSRSQRHAQLGGGWWVDYENFRTIASYARTHSLGLSYAARLFLALPIDWTRADRIVSAILEIPLRAYAGKGKQAQTRGDRWTPVQHLPVKQLYIPGLYREGRPRPALRARLSEPELRICRHALTGRVPGSARPAAYRPGRSAGPTKAACAPACSQRRD